MESPDDGDIELIGADPLEEAMVVTDHAAEGMVETGATPKTRVELLKRPDDNVFLFADNNRIPGVLELHTGNSTRIRREESVQCFWIDRVVERRQVNRVNTRPLWLVTASGVPFVFVLGRPSAIAASNPLISLCFVEPSKTLAGTVSIADRIDANAVSGNAADLICVCRSLNWVACSTRIILSPNSQRADKILRDWYSCRLAAKGR